MLAVASSTAFWYAARGTGLVALVLLTIVLVLGIAQVERWSAPGWPRFVVGAVHRNASLLVVVFLAVHIASSIIDGFAPISWVSAFVPYTSAYRPLWLGLGAVAFDLIIALVVTSLVRQRLGHRAWRVVHWTAYACWPVAFLHGLGTGTDTKVNWVLLVNLACLLTVVAALGWRLFVGWQEQPFWRAAGVGASAMVVVAMLGWLAQGPTQVGWAKKAGTPAELLNTGTGESAAGDPTPGVPGAPPDAPFDATFSGTVQEALGAGTAATVTIDATLADGVDGRLTVVIQGQASSEGGVTMEQSKVTLGPAADPGQYTGTVTTLRGSRLEAQVQGPNGARTTLTIDLTIDEDTRTVTGTVSARPTSGASTTTTAPTRSTAPPTTRRRGGN